MAWTTWPPRDSSTSRGSRGGRAGQRQTMRWTSPEVNCSGNANNRCCHVKCGQRGDTACGHGYYSIADSLAFAFRIHTYIHAYTLPSTTPGGPTAPPTRALPACTCHPPPSPDFLAGRSSFRTLPTWCSELRFAYIRFAARALPICWHVCAKRSTRPHTPALRRYYFAGLRPNQGRKSWSWSWWAYMRRNRLSYRESDFRLQMIS